MLKDLVLSDEKEIVSVYAASADDGNDPCTVSSSLADYAYLTLLVSRHCCRCRSRCLQTPLVA